MFRKALKGLGLLAVGGYLWFGTSAGSYFRTGYNQARNFILGQVPVEFEIERARQLIAEIVPEVQRTKRSILNEEVKVARLRQEADAVAKNLESERLAILALREQIGKGLASYKIGDTTYSSAAMQRELGRRFASFKHVDETLKAKREILVSRESSLLSAREKHDRLLECRQELESKLAALEARFKMIEVKKLASKVQVDDSQVKQLQSLMSEIEDRLEVESKEAEEDGVLMRTIPIEKASTGDLGQEIDQYFGKAKPTNLSST